MKQQKSYLKLLCACAGILGGALRYWTLSAGEDSKGLYPVAHPGWIGYLVLSAIMVGVCLWLSRQPAQTSQQPGSRICFLIGNSLAALGLILYDLSAFGNAFATLVSLVGIALALLLLRRLWQPQKGSPVTLCGLACLYFALEMFRLNLNFGGEPELLRFIPQFLAMLSASLACYQLWGKAVDLESPQKRLFWQCLAGYLSIAAAPGAHIMYAGVGIFLLCEPFTPQPTAEEFTDTDR